MRKAMFTQLINSLNPLAVTGRIELLGAAVSFAMWAVWMLPSNLKEAYTLADVLLLCTFFGTGMGHLVRYAFVKRIARLNDCEARRTAQVISRYREAMEKAGMDADLYTQSGPTEGARRTEKV